MRGESPGATCQRSRVIAEVHERERTVENGGLHLRVSDLEHITNRRIWTNHCCPSDTQIENLLEDRTLADVSAKLDSNVAKIRSYRPSIDITNISKKERVTERVTQIKTDINRFRDGNQKNPSKAKLMIESLKFLNNQLELLNLEGIPYTQESVGVEPNEVANNIEELENYLSEQDSQAESLGAVKDKCNCNLPNSQHCTYI